MSSHHHDVSRDKGPAFLGLFGGLVLIGALMYGMVVWTNGQFAAHGAGATAPAAGAPASH